MKSVEDMFSKDLLDNEAKDELYKIINKKQEISRYEYSLHNR